MMKFISSIIAFSLTFILSVVLIGVPKNTYHANYSNLTCYTQNQKNIVSLLRRDIRNGDVRSQEIKELLTLRLDKGARCADVLVQTEKKMAEIDEKLRSLQAVKRASAKGVARKPSAPSPTGASSRCVVSKRSVLRSPSPSGNTAG